MFLFLHVLTYRSIFPQSDIVNFLCERIMGIPRHIIQNFVGIRNTGFSEKTYSLSIVQVLILLKTYDVLE